MDTSRSANADRRRAPTVLILSARTGGGHESAAVAIGEALASGHPRLTSHIRDPLTGPRAPGWLRRGCGLYAPLTRHAPYAWAALFHAADSFAGQRLVTRTAVRICQSSVRRLIDIHRPQVVVAVHPLLVSVAAAAIESSGQRVPLATVITDLATAHRTWFDPPSDILATPTVHLRTRHPAGVRSGDVTGIPVREPFRSRPRLYPGSPRRALGIGDDKFVVLAISGAEGARGLEAWVHALASHRDDTVVVAACGHNARLRRRLDAFAARVGDRVIVNGFVDNMADWMRSADILVTRAGPGVIAEAAAVGLPMLLAGHLPGQEVGNSELVVAAGAGAKVRGRRELIATVDQLRRDRGRLERMRAAALRFGRPHAAGAIADHIASLIDNGHVRAAYAERMTTTRRESA